MSRIVNVLFALVLLVALAIAFDPELRRRATEKVREWEPALKQLDDRIVINAPPFGTPDGRISTPVPAATAVAEDDEQIPVTGDEDSSDEPIIQVNWDALGDSLRELWVRLKNMEIDLSPDFTPKDNK